jgi:hypothetical protein
MREIVGNLFVWTGVLLFLAQVILTLATAIKPKADTLLAADAGYFEKVFKALVDKFPVAALGIAAVWLGSSILGWI